MAVAVEVAVAVAVVVVVLVLLVVAAAVAISTTHIQSIVGPNAYYGDGRGEEERPQGQTLHALRRPAAQLPLETCIACIWHQRKHVIHTTHSTEKRQLCNSVG